MIFLRPVLYRLRLLFIIFPSTWYQMIGIEKLSEAVFLEAYFPFLIMSDADIPSPIRIFKNTL